jgi:hypothetical protein
MHSTAKQTKVNTAPAWYMGMMVTMLSTAKQTKVNTAPAWYIINDYFILV